MKTFSIQLKSDFQISIFFAILFLGQLSLSGQQITLTLDNVPPNVVCDEVWTEANLDLNFTQTTSLDCDGGGNCFYEVDAGFVWLFPSRLVVDLSGLQNIINIEVDVLDFCGSNCTRAFIEDSNNLVVASAGNTSVGSIETLSLLNSAGEMLSELAMSSCEGQILEMRIFQDVGCVAGVNTFVGTGNLWSDPSNWSLLRIPEICHDVIIPSSKSVQILTGESAICHTLDVETNATFEVSQSSELFVAAGN